MPAYGLKVHGQVQGVFYRHSAQQQARQLGLSGLARNESDGSVHIEVEGDERSLKEFIDWARVGPSSAKVERVEVEEQPVQGYREFEIE